MTRQEVKRFLALLKAQVEYPDRDIQIDLPEGFKESFENQDAFRGWINYHVTWDVDLEDVWKVIIRTRSLVAEWHEELARHVPVIQPDGTIVSAEDYNKAQN